MNFGLTEQEEALRQAARACLERESPKTLVREMESDEKGYSEKLWHKMADLGWMRLTIPHKYGGFGGRFLDVAILLEEMGRALVPGPFFATAVAGAPAITGGGDEPLKQRLLPGIAKGDVRFALALTEPGGTCTSLPSVVRASLDETRFVINGTKLFVPYAKTADYLICTARTRDVSSKESGVTVFVVDSKTPGIRYALLDTIADDKQYEVVFDKVSVPTDNVIGGVDRGWPVLEGILLRGAVGKCSEMVGIAQRALEISVEYSKQRVQFGRPIGAFQAIQHHLANMALDIDTSRLLTYQAAWRLSEGLPCKFEVAMAKSWTSDACRRVVALGHQIHGGVGFSMECDMQLYFRRAKAAELAFGQSDFHLDVVAAGMDANR